MKKILALGLATAMVSGMGTAAFAKNDARYPVGSIEPNAYLYDEDDNHVDLSTPVETVPYGETLYFPLLSKSNVENAEAIAKAQALLNEKAAAHNAKVELHKAALAALETATAAHTQKGEALTAITELRTAATAWQAVVGQEGEAAAKSSYEAVAAKLSITPAADAETAVTNAKELVSAAEREASDAEAAMAEATATVATEKAAMDAAKAEADAAKSALEALTNKHAKYVYESDAVSGIRIREDWDMNGKLVEKVEIAKKKTNVAKDIAQKYLYFVAVTLKDNGAVKDSDISGTIELRKSGSFDYEDMSLEVDMAISFPTADDNTITTDLQVFSEGNGFDGDSEEELRFAADEDSYFVVNTIGQKEILLSMNTDFDAKIAEKHPNANLDFFNGNGGTFNKTGTLYLAADKDSFVYRINDNGTMSVLQPEYDSYEEAFAIRTRTLGRYVISDTLLKFSNDPGSEKPSKPSNPNTGVIA